MRCLHCGKELALLKRMRGGGQFCSEAHKQSYQEEYNRIALSRLLQAQAKPAAAKSASAKDKPPIAEPPPAPVAVEELAEEVEQTAEFVEALEQEVLVEEAVEATADETPEEPEEESENELGFEAIETAGFVVEFSAVPVFPEETLPYVESWQAEAPAPVVPSWYFEGRGEPVLPGGEVVRLELRPNLSDNEHSAGEANVIPNEFVPSNANPPGLPGMRISNRLQAAGPIALEIAPRSSESSRR